MMHRVIIECPPGKQIDHINNNKLDNRKCNLRAVTNQENQFNRPTVKGYYLHKKSGKYMAYIMRDRHQHYLGLYETTEEAHAAYLEAKKETHTMSEINNQTNSEYNNQIKPNQSYPFKSELSLKRINRSTKSHNKSNQPHKPIQPTDIPT